MYNPEIKYCDEKQHLLLPGVALNKLELFLQKRKIPYSITSPGKEDYDDDWGAQWIYLGRSGFRHTVAVISNIDNNCLLHIAEELVNITKENL